ncbi:MAG: acyloxyacyl hydrolase [Bacteroidia bacterium]
MRFRFLLYLSLVLFTDTRLMAQTPCPGDPGCALIDGQAVCIPGKEPLVITPGFQYGFIIAHHSDMLYLTQGHIAITEVCVARPTHGHHYWDQLFNYPEPGVSFCVFDLGNPQNLGNLYSISPYFDFPFNRSERTRFCFRVGTGLCYLTKPFDPVTNYKNIAIGSHVNGFVNLRLTWKQEFCKNFRSDLGISFSHCSNGAFKTPNLGLNMPALYAGLGYMIRPCGPRKRYDTIPHCDQSRFFAMGIGTAVSQISPPGGHYFPGIVLTGTINRFWNSKNLWCVGVEIFYNEANYQEIHRNDSTVTRKNYIQPAFKIGYSLCVGRFSMPIEAGVYLYDRVSGETVPIYTHLGLRYQINHRLLAGVMLKTYFARAEFFEWGITYRFIRPKC